MNRDIIYKELKFKAVRSSGAGGQHVNKVSSKVELFFDIPNSKGLSTEEKEVLQKHLSSKLTKDGILQLNASDSRSQHTNKEKVILRFFEVLKKGLVIPKKRKATKPSKASIQKRLQNKQSQSNKKVLRKKPNLE
ncbi:alternative ribosome rescue aminoacyl-tRNA hydrolase ArfB [Flavobacteriaceae bacterium S356]|uniref:Alternative ribosome rescue aminoacyl-tRNA hydrolase ArfB n=1 Tax=Asprobacillus argus TaxID=3076534 RepID=A0ABU3LD95_9FLAO|nr:alternative ribosome rescue aminoacyl-tRNA hydrolase ArfB [Flavobacteriaceae bacterium S356]